MKIAIFLSLTLFLFSCEMKSNCKDETERISKTYMNCVISKKYIKNHNGWIEGVDSLGRVQKFQYYGFQWLDDLAEPGDWFFKDSLSMEFKLKKSKYLYTFQWDCLTSGKLIKVDTLKKIN